MSLGAWPRRRKTDAEHGTRPTSGQQKWAASLNVMQPISIKPMPQTTAGASCRERDSNPHSHFWPRDFKSLVSTNSTIAATAEAGLSPNRVQSYHYFP